MGPNADPVAAAFAAVPRADFLPARSRGEAAYDGPIPIGHDQTNSQPRTVEAMLRLLQVQPGQEVLDVGSGSGWTTALLAHLVGPTGKVVGVELVPELADWGALNLAVHAGANARIVHADPDALGFPEEAPYDRILVSAEARELPRSLVEQLRPGGRMVIPVSGLMTVVVTEEGGPRITTHGGYRFVPLVTPAGLTDK